MRRAPAPPALLLLLCTARPAVANLVVDGSFEISYTAQGNGYAYRPQGSWTFQGGGGVSSVLTPDWSGGYGDSSRIDAGDGSYYAFLQGQSSVCQPLGMSIGQAYTVSWLQNARPYRGTDGNSLVVSLDLERTVHTEPPVYYAAAWSPRNATFVNTGSNTELCFVGATAGDVTVFVDNVVVEPATSYFKCAAGDDPTQCAALGVLYAATNGADWLSRDGWRDASAGTPTSLCQFFGVTCDGTGAVTYLCVERAGGATVDTALTRITSSMCCAPHG